jgi:hypothetical protein
LVTTSSESGPEFIGRQWVREALVELVKTALEAGADPLRCCSRGSDGALDSALSLAIRMHAGEGRDETTRLRLQVLVGAADTREPCCYAVQGGAEQQVQRLDPLRFLDSCQVHWLDATAAAQTPHTEIREMLEGRNQQLEAKNAAAIQEAPATPQQQQQQQQHQQQMPAIVPLQSPGMGEVAMASAAPAPQSNDRASRKRPLELTSAEQLQLAYEKMAPHEQRKFQTLLSQKDTQSTALSGAAGSSSGALHSSDTTGLFEHLDDDGLKWYDGEAHVMTAAELLATLDDGGEGLKALLESHSFGET